MKQALFVLSVKRGAMILTPLAGNWLVKLQIELVAQPLGSKVLKTVKIVDDIVKMTVIAILCNVAIVELLKEKYSVTAMNFLQPLSRRQQQARKIYSSSALL